ncbi:MAG: DNA-3-methyladenine glycosylase family protein [Methylocystaceae bacterium]
MVEQMHEELDYPTFKYGNQEIEYLKSRDKKLGAAIEQIGMINRRIIPDPFTALVTSVISQQISSKAAETVNKKFIALISNITPENIDMTPLSSIQQCGMSQRKAEYIKGIATAAILGQVDFKALPTLPDDEIVHHLTSLRGVGLWTAEMLLIFSLCRPDVVSYKDLAIVRGMMNLYGLKELSPQQFARYRKRYSPYGSVASLYLWALSVM